jgi:hypothetical protein
MKRVIAQILLGLILLSGRPVLGYEEIEVTNGGTVVGEVKFRGTYSGPAQLQVSKNQDFCGQHVLSEKLIVGGNKGLKNVVITLEGIAQGKKVDKSTKPILDNVHCRFVPHVQAVTLGTKLEIRNSDPILHNTHGFLDKKTVFNLALPLKGQKILKRLRKPGIVRVKCDAGHEWMRAYIVVTEHPYHAVTDETGSFQITDIPPGNYQLRAWHEELGTKVQEVVIEAGKESKVGFNF